MDSVAMGKILVFIWEKADQNPMAGPVDHEITLNTLQLIADQVNREPFWLNKPLRSIANSIQEFYNKIKNPVNGKSNSQSGTISREKVSAELEKRIAQRKQAGNKPVAEDV